MKSLLTPTLIALAFGLAAPAMAQTDHSMHGMPAATPVATAKPAATGANADMGEGLVKKVDKEKGTVTLTHGALPNGMPPMTMVFVAKDKSMLDKVKAGDKVRFVTVHENGQMIVTDLQPR